MLESPLPNIIEPLKLATKNVRLQGCVDLKSLSRLRADLLPESLSEQASADLQLGLSADGLAIMTGSVRTVLHLECQRCLGSMDWPVDAKVSWVFAHNEEAAIHLPASSELILLEEESVSLFDLLEDELLLSLPSVPLHLEGQCMLPDTSVIQTHQAQSKGDVKKSPFVVLADFKKKD